MDDIGFGKTYYEFLDQSKVYVCPCNAEVRINGSRTGNNRAKDVLKAEEEGGRLK